MYDLPGGTFFTNYAEEMRVVRTPLRMILLILFLIFMSVWPILFASSSMVQLFNIFIVWIIAGHGLNILTGLCGQVSLGHAAFVGVGSYTAAILSTRYGFPFWISLPCAGLSSALIGVLFGLPSIRVKGYYLALTSMAAHFILLYVFLHWESLTGGIKGLSCAPVKVGHFSLDTPYKFFPFALAFCVIMTSFFNNFKRSQIGRLFIAINNNDLAAEALGINISKYKLMAFGIGCFYAGIAGALLAYNFQFVSLDYFPFIDSFWYVGILIIGGIGSVLGPIFGVIFIRWISQLMNLHLAPLIAGLFPALGAQIASSISVIVFALIIMVFVVFEPRGLAYRWSVIKSYYRLWPFPY